MRKAAACLLLILGITAICDLWAEEYDPRANSKAVVIQGKTRFTVLTPQMIRMEWSANGRFEDHASLLFVNRNLDAPKFTASYCEGWLVISTEKLKLRYKKDSGKFSPDNLRISLDLNGKDITWKPGLKDQHNLKGTYRTLDGFNGPYNWAGKEIKLGEGAISRSGWVLIDDSNTHILDSSDWPWVMLRPEGEKQDWYFFGHGHDYKQALHDFTLVAGKIPMPPKFAFGYWWSRYWIYSDRELRQLIHDMKSLDIPIDVLIIDMEWHKTFGLSGKNTKRDPFKQPVGWTGYTWNRDLFPEPKRFLEWTEEQNLKTALNLHPASGIPPMEECYESFAGKYGFDTSNREYIPYAMAEKRFAETYFEVVIQPFEQQGIDFWWIDWQQWPNSKIVEGLSNTWWLNYTFFTHMERTGRRPLLFHRWGGLGNHRYQIGFSGDTKATWASLAFQPYFTATASNVGYGYWSHDIGGHMPGGPQTDPELYLRWIQYGIFSPMVRTHSTKSSIIERRIWKFADHFDLMREALHTRYALVPYIYSASRQAYETGVSICRPMYYDYPEQEEAYGFSDQYMFGEDILVSPVAEPISSDTLLADKKIWLPEGKWYEWSTGALFEGGRVIERGFSLAEIPVYMKAGAIIPMNPKVNNLQEPIDLLVLTIIPGGSSDTVLYEDDGNTVGYQKGEYAKTRITNETGETGGRRITIFPRKGYYTDMPVQRSYEIRLPSSFPPDEVLVNGKKYDYKTKLKPGSWTYLGADLSTKILTPRISCNEKLEVVVTHGQESENRRDILNGKKGMFKRLSTVTNILRYEVAGIDWGAAPPDKVLHVEQTPTRLDYNHDTAVQELERFDRVLLEAIKQIKTIPNLDPEVIIRCINHLSMDERN